MSQADNCCSQNPSNRPTATSARSIAAAPGRRIPLVARATLPNWRLYSSSRDIARNGKPVPISANSGSTMVELEYAIESCGDRYRIAGEAVQKVCGSIEHPFRGTIYLGHKVAAALEGPGARIARPLDAPEVGTRVSGGGLCQMQ